METCWSIVVCNNQFEIQSVTHSEGFVPKARKGDHISAITAPHDIPRLLNLIQLLNQDIPSFGHELSVILDSEGTTPIQIGGFPAEEGVYFVLYKNYLDLYEELIAINNEQTNRLREKMKAASIQPSHYEALSGLNNELLNSQRELQKKNRLIETLLEEKEQMNHSLQESNQLKSQLIGVIGHDLRNPLSHIIGYLEVVSELVNKDQWDEELQGLSEGIIGTAKSSLNTLENLVMWSKSSQHGFQVQWDAVDLGALIDEILQLEQLALSKKNIIIRRNKRASGLVLWSDRNVLSVIIRNIFANAIKYTEKGGSIGIRIETQGDREGNDSICIKISDTGRGMTPQELQWFNQGQIGHSTRGTLGEKGSGLGLSITKQMIQKIGGKMAVESTPGQGTTVTLYFEAVVMTTGNEGKRLS